MFRKLKLALPALGLMAVVYYADYLVFAPPIILLTAWLGAWPAFIILTPLYFIFDYVLGSISLRFVQTDKKTKPRGPILKLIYRWFAIYKDLIPKLKDRLSARAGLLIRIVGFVFASYWGTAFLTMPAMYLLGQRRHLKILTAASAAIYAVTFVGQVAGITFIGIKIIQSLVARF
jgi:hypothetical protein